MSHYNPLVQALLTDKYQITMARSYFECGKHKAPSSFDLFFRTAPFKGAFAVFAGLRQAMEYIRDFHVSSEDIDYLQQDPDLQGASKEFWTWFSELDCSEMKIWAPPEGTIVFPRTPLLRVEGPIGITNLVETALLNQINYATLVATNAAHLRLVAGWDKTILEFGLRRAQGADGGISASLYTYLGSFDGTSNYMAGRLFGIPVKGTHAHSWVMAHTEADLDHPRLLKTADGNSTVDLTLLAKMFLSRIQKEGLVSNSETNKAELASFLNYGWKNPDNCLSLIDTYSVLNSGLPNFLAVALALNSAGYRPKGIRLDSGDLAFLSIECREAFIRVGKFFNIDYFGRMIVTASNDLNKTTITELNNQGHEINAYGIGTNAVTCDEQPALGGVYKLEEIDEILRIKLAEDSVKITIPGRKNTWRLIGQNGAILDIMTLVDEPMPMPGQEILCCHPFIETKRAIVCPVNVKPLSTEVWDGGIIKCTADYKGVRDYVIEQLRSGQIRPDHLRSLNPTPYKVSVSVALYEELHKLMVGESAVARLQ